MAAPQPDKVLRISEELLDAILRFQFGGRQLRVVLAVMRQTYRYGKKEDWVSLTRLADMLGSYRSNVSRTISELVKMGVLSKRQQDGRQIVGIVKDYEKWKVLSNQQPVIKTIPKVLSKRRTPSKGREVKEREVNKTLSPEAIRLSGLLASLMLENNPKHTRLSNGKLDATVNAWADPIEKLNRIDGQPWDEIETVIRWCQKDDFWMSNILSGKTLRKQYDRLRFQAIKRQPDDGLRVWTLEDVETP